jgi:hypothetical protein
MGLFVWDEASNELRRNLDPDVVQPSVPDIVGVWAAPRFDPELGFHNVSSATHGRKALDKHREKFEGVLMLAFKELSPGLHLRPKKCKKRV